MDKQVAPINANEKIYLQQIIDQVHKSVKVSGIILILMAVGSAIIPAGFLGRGMRGESATLLEYFGPVGVFIFLLIMAGIFYGINVYDHKYFKIKEDLEEGKKAIFTAIVKSISIKKDNHGRKMHQLRLGDNPMKVKKLLVYNERISGFPSEGSLATFEVTKLHKVPLTVRF